VLRPATTERRPPGGHRRHSVAVQPPLQRWRHGALNPVADRVVDGPELGAVSQVAQGNAGLGRDTTSSGSSWIDVLRRSARIAM